MESPGFTLAGPVFATIRWAVRGRVAGTLDMLLLGTGSVWSAETAPSLTTCRAQASVTWNSRLNERLWPESRSGRTQRNWLETMAHATGGAGGVNAGAGRRPPEVGSVTITWVARAGPWFVTVNL